MVRLSLLSWISITSCVILVFARAQDQSGFVSIDCVIPDYSSYSDEKTNMKYVSDLGFVESGISHSIGSNLETTSLERQFQNVRSFPEGTTMVLVKHLSLIFILELISGNLLFLSMK